MFEIGNQYGKKSKRGKSLDLEMREKIKHIAHGLIDTINIDILTNNQRISLLKSVLPYLLPKELYGSDETMNEEEKYKKPPTVIIFKDTNEYKSYNKMSEEEKDRMIMDATPLLD